jgi:hypothetical protein
MDLDEILAAEERLAGNDAAVALLLARTVTRSDAAALALWEQAQAHAAALAATPEFRQMVRTVARELVARRELGRQAFAALVAVRDAATDRDRANPPSSGPAVASMGR